MSDLTNSEIKEECQANAYEEWLQQQGDCYILNQLIGLMATDPLTELEVKVICNMVRDRDFTGAENIYFEDLRSSI